MQGVWALQSTRGQTNCVGDNNSPYTKPVELIFKDGFHRADSQKVSKKGVKEVCVP